MTILLAALGFSLGAATQVHGQRPVPLTPDRVIEGELKGGESHLYQLTLAAGESAQIELRAGPTRLRLALLSETGELITAISDADSPGQKRLHIVAARTTNYRISIAQESGRPVTTPYRLALLEKRAATPADRERFALHILSWEVVSLYRQQEKSALYQAAAKAREVAARWQALGDHEWAGRMFDRAGRSLFLLSEHQAGREAFQKAVAAFQKAGERRKEIFSVGNLGLLELADGEYRQAFSLAVRTFLYLQSARDEDGIRSVRLLQAMHYRNIGEWQQAEALCRQLLPEADINRIDEWDRVYREDVLMVLGIALAGQRHFAEGISVLEEALALARPTSNQLNVVTILVQLGMAHQMAGQPTQALAAFEQCAAASRRLGIRSYESQSLGEAGHLYLLAGRRAEARAALRRAVEAGIYGGKNYLSVALHHLAQLQHDEGQFTEALASVEQAVQIVEGLRVQLPMQDAARVTTGLLERDAYALRLDLLLHLHERDRTAGYDARALQASEFAHARSLVQLLSEQPQAGLASADPALTAQLNELRLSIARLTNEQLRLRANAAPVSARQSVQEKLATALAEMDRVTIAMRDRDPRTAALTLPEPLKLREVQEQIPDRDTILLEYALGEERSFLFVVSPTSLQVFNLPRRSVIEPVARRIYEILSRSQQPKIFRNSAEKQAWLRRNERASALAAAQLSKLLLKPAAALLGRKRLMIVPDGALHYVPFAALPEPSAVSRQSSVVKGNAPRPTDNGQRTTDNGQPLIASHEIITLPSASTMAALRRELTGRKPASKTLVVFADPVFDQNDERVTSPQQPPPPALTPAASLERLRVFGQVEKEGNFSFLRLPASRVEAEAILALVPPAERKAAMDFDASYQTATQGDLGQYRLIHFATHGLLDETHPELSGLLLSQVNRQGGNENGFFTTLDAFNLKLNAELVVLSGCRTALGREVNGEGLIGLTRGFMYAGARRVMASLWQVSDAATAELMQRFYEGLLGEKKLSAAAALRAAQLEVMKDPRYSAPYYWAAFTLQGDQ
ncbi:MAG: CHAT domain-containing tetratricopeptide repeat protein [Blastocatellia bacterium]